MDAESEVQPVTQVVAPLEEGSSVNTAWGALRFICLGIVAYGAIGQADPKYLKTMEPGNANQVNALIAEGNFALNAADGERTTAFSLFAGGTAAAGISLLGLKQIFEEKEKTRRSRRQRQQLTADGS